jgi:hypothetical protein
MQQNHFGIFHCEQHTCDVVADLAAHFPDRPSQVIDQWLAYGLFVLDIGNVLTYGLPIRFVQSL